MSSVLIERAGSICKENASDLIRMWDAVRSAVKKYGSWEMFFGFHDCGVDSVIEIDDEYEEDYREARRKYKEIWKMQGNEMDDGRVRLGLYQVDRNGRIR